MANTWYLSAYYTIVLGLNIAIMKRILTFALVLISIFARGQSLEVNRLSQDQIDQLYKACKVWGYLKYYHPGIAKGKYDWYKELVDRIPAVLHSSSSEETNQLLYDWVNSLRKSPKQTEYKINTKIRLKPNITWIDDTNLLGDELSKALVAYKNAKRGKKSHYIKFDGSGITFTNEKLYANMDYQKRDMQLLALFRYWNIVEYFNPYRYLTNDWENVLRAYIPRFYKTTSSLQYRLLIKELVNEINDSHTLVYWDDELKSFFGTNAPAIDARKIENKIVVYRLLPGFDHEHDLREGDVIAKVDDVIILDKLAKLSKYVPASNEAIKDYGAIQMALRTNKK